MGTLGGEAAEAVGGGGGRAGPRPGAKGPGVDEEPEVNGSGDVGRGSGREGRAAAGWKLMASVPEKRATLTERATGRRAVLGRG